MTITAKFPGFCPCCNGPIHAGDKVEWTKGAKATHAACAASAPAARPQSAYRPRQLRNGDEYTSRRTGQRAVFGCAHCSRLGRMCPSCEHDAD